MEPPSVRERNYVYMVDLAQEGCGQWMASLYRASIHVWAMCLLSSQYEWMKQSNINFGSVFKLGGFGNWPHSLCTNFVGLESAIMIASIGSKLCLREIIAYKFNKMIMIWHFLRGIMLWLIWIERNDNFFNHEQGHESKVKQRIGDKLIIYTKGAWNRVVEQMKISKFPPG